MMNKAGICSLIGWMMMTVCSCQSGQDTATKQTVTLMTLDPGHFHASLVQKSMYPQVNPVVYVYAPEGDDVKEHLKRIDGYNTRVEKPTTWKEEVYTGPDYLARMLAEKKGNVVVLAGNNRLKTEYIKSAVDAGLNVLSDKPMCIDSKGFELLKAAYESAKTNQVLLYDIMTERYEITTLLQKELAHTSEVFGDLKAGTEQDPSIVKESVHHFFKIVSGNPLKRPAWYYDTTQQGEGIVDVTTHLVDLSMWEAFPDHAIDYTRDVKILSSSRWPTLIAKEQYQKSTQQTDFPDYLKSKLDNSGKLPCYCNGEINYVLHGVCTKVSVTWNFEPPVGGGDTHYSIMKGTKANVLILQGAEQKYKPELYVEPVGEVTADNLGSALFKAVIQMQAKYPGIMAIREGNRFKIAIPESYRVGHEAHFAQVAEKYLKFLNEGTLPAWELPNILTKYNITTQALANARTLDSAPAKETKPAADAFAAIGYGVCTSIDNAEILRDNGFQFVEEGVQKLLIPEKSEEQFATLLAKTKSSLIPVYACNGFLPATLRVTGPDAMPDDILRYAEIVFRRAGQGGIKRIVFGSSKSREIPAGFDKQQARRQFVELLGKLGPIAAQYGVVVVIEPLRSKECNFVNTVAEATAIAKEVNHPNIAVLADFYHMAQESEGPQSLLAAGKLLQHCHIAEKDNRTYPGAAGDDFKPYFKALTQIGYTGGISIEGSWGEGLKQNLPVAMKTMKEQMAACR